MISIVAPLLLACAPLPATPQTQVPPAVVFGLAYDPQNPFAKILRGEIPVAKVYENRHLLAFMDNAPASPGHILIISKDSQARNLLEVRDRQLRRMLDLARRIGAADLTGLGADGFTIEQNNGYSQSVPHLHIHVIPRYIGYSRCRGNGLHQEVDVLEPFAAAIRAALAAQPSH